MSDLPQGMFDRQIAAEMALARAVQKLMDQHELIVVEKRRIPAGAKLVECYETNGGFIIIGDPESDDATHNCDQMGCGSLSHVLYRFEKTPPTAHC